MNRVRVVLYIVWCVISTNAISAELPSIPFLQHYTKATYKAGTQNWQIIQSSNDIMYFANNYGVLRFDGTHWQLKPVDNHSIVRSVCEIGEDSILVGAHGDFGLITNNEYGEMQYQSWANKVSPECNEFHEVWRIYTVDSMIFVQTFYHLFVFNNGKFTKCFTPKAQFKYMFKFKNTIYIQDLGSGIYYYEDDKLKELSGTDFYNDKEVWFINETTDGNMLFGTQFNGLYVYNGIYNQEWQTEANKFLKKNNLFSAVKLKNKKFVFGTIQDGYIQTDMEGNIFSHLNNKSGLLNNTVLSLVEDRSNNLWIGMDNGLDYALINSPFTILQKKNGFGTGYSAEIFEQKLYVGTNQGLFSIPYTENENQAYWHDFEQINIAQGQVWKLKRIANTLFICHNFGLFEIKNNILIKRNISTGVWNIKQVPNKPNMFLLGTYKGFYIYNKANGAIKMLKGFSLPVRHFEFDAEGNVLLSHVYKGIYRISIDYDSFECEILEHYNGANLLPKDYGNNLFKIRGKLIASTDSGVYSYSNKGFVKYKVWDNFFEGNASGIFTIEELDDNIIICFKDGAMYKITWLNDKMYDVQSEKFSLINNTFPRSNENIMQIDDSRYLIGNENGFVIYNKNKEGIGSSDIKMSLHKAYYIDKRENQKTDIAYGVNDNHYDLKRLDYSKNSLLLSLSTPVYKNSTKIYHRIKLNNGPWNEWYEGNDVELHDLKEGDYYINIECSKNKTDVVGSISISLAIDPPLYRRWYSYLFYLFMFFASSLFGSSMLKRKIAYEKRKESILQQRKTIENRVKLKRKAELAQTELTQLRNEKLKTDIRHKSKELANTTMSIIQKNQMLQQIKDVLVKISKADRGIAENKEVSRLLKRINKEIDNQDNWTVFERNFDKVHENFLKRLKEQHSELTPKDLRLAAYLRMNLSSKEIAPLLNISIRSVEISRYRLRKKMNLDHDQNLTEYLIKL